MGRLDRFADARVQLLGEELEIAHAVPVLKGDVVGAEVPRRVSQAALHQQEEKVGHLLGFEHLLGLGSGFRVQGSGFRVQGSGFRVQGSGFRVQGYGLRVKD